MVKVHSFVHHAKSFLMFSISQFVIPKVVRVSVGMIRCLEYGMLMEVDWLYIVLIIVSVVELMVSLVVNMVGRSRGLVMVIPMMHNWLKVKSFMVGRLKMNSLVMGRL